MAKKASATPDPRFEVLRMLTEVQKDKLLLKLFRKDPLLVEKLAFEFFEDKSDLNRRVNDIKQNIDKYLTLKYIPWNTPGDLMMQMRSLNASITEHVKITKDKHSEIELTILLLNTAFERFQTMLNEKKQRSGTFSKYVVTRTVKVLQLLQKMHPDNDLDFKADLNRLLAYLYAYSPTSDLAKDEKLPPQYFR
jgi:HSP90 family molecular chaperone